MSGQTNIREYAEEMGVEVKEWTNGRVVVQAFNEAGYNFTLVDLLDVIAWVRLNKPELLTSEHAASSPPPSG